MINVIGSNGYIGSNLMREFPRAVGITRDTTWPTFDRDDWVINAASYFWHGKPLDLNRAWNTNYDIPSRLLETDANVIHLTSEAAEVRIDDPVWQAKKQGDDLLIGKAHILIIPTLYGGINQHKHMFMTALLDHIRHGTPFTLTTPNLYRDFVHIGELITIIRDIIELRFRAIRVHHRLTSWAKIPMLAMLKIAEGIAAEIPR